MPIFENKTDNTESMKLKFYNKYSIILLEHGSIDMVVERNTMKKTLHDLLNLFSKDVA